jgi:hypothetical protein
LHRLSCGCEFRSEWKPQKAGAYVSCANGIKHQSSYRIVSTVEVAEDESGQAPGPVVQLALFGGAA